MSTLLIGQMSILNSLFTESKDMEASGAIRCNDNFTLVNDTQGRWYKDFRWVHSRIRKHN